MLFHFRALHESWFLKALHRLYMGSGIQRVTSTKEVVILNQAAVRDSFIQQESCKRKRGPEQHARQGVAQSNRPMPWHIPGVHAVTINNYSPKKAAIASSELNCLNVLTVLQVGI